MDNYIVRFNKPLLPQSTFSRLHARGLCLGVESSLRKLALAAASLLGVGYVAISVPVLVLLVHRFLQIPIASMENVNALASTTLFFMASVLLMLLGCFLVIGGLQYYRGGAHAGVVFLGSLLGCSYLLCLGLGSLLIEPQVNIYAIFLTISPVLIMGAVAVYMGRLGAFKLIGSVLGIVGGVLLAFALVNYQIFEFVFGWGIPFPGPFMSVPFLEAIVIVMGPLAGFVFFVLSGHEEKPVAYTLVSIMTMVYGVGTFVGTQVLAFGFLNYLWKAPWEGPFYAMPPWVFNAVAFWSASLFLLMIGGIMLVVSSCLGFVFAAEEFSQL